jgi:uncharacterized repeat protein (TIGR01451 family)
LRSLTGNQTIGFGLGVVGVVFTLLAWLYPHFWETFYPPDPNLRARVEISKLEKVLTIPPIPPFGTAFKYAITLKNAGNVVAKNVKFHIDNVDADTSLDGMGKGIRMYQDQQFHEMSTGKRATSPDRPAPKTLAPGEMFPVPLYTAGQEPRRYGDNFRYTFLIGRIDYDDGREKRWSRFCFLITNSRGDLGHCQFGNDDDESAPTEQ